ncbi:MAG: hypothetical protein ACFFEF_12385 [Candidatus Thorarchaeota archaeon]
MLRSYTFLYSILVFVLMTPIAQATVPSEQLATSPTVLEDEPISMDVIVDVKPNTLYTNSKGCWVTCYITPPMGYDARDIDVTTVTLEGVSALPDQYGYVDVNLDGLCELMVKFDRDTILELLPKETCHDYPLTITGCFLDGVVFIGIDMIHIVYK